MKTTKLLTNVFRFLCLGFMIANLVWYTKTGLAFISSPYLLWGSISCFLLLVIFQNTYYIQAKKYNEVRNFFLSLAIFFVALYLLGFLGSFG